jgi:hypothetical protein
MRWRWEELKGKIVCRIEFQASLRDAEGYVNRSPWVETHGYHRESLRDQNAVGWWWIMREWLMPVDREIRGDDTKS